MIPFFQKNSRRPSDPAAPPELRPPAVPPAWAASTSCSSRWIGIPVLVRTLTALERAQRVDSIVIAHREEDLITVSQLCKTYGITKCKKVIRAGRTGSTPYCWRRWRQSRTRSCWPSRDGARPLVSPTPRGTV